MTPLAPITNKRTMPTFRRGPGGKTRDETWYAETADGTFSFVREESPGTPWLIVHRSTDRVVMTCSSLAKCRRAVAMGWTKEPEE